MEQAQRREWTVTGMDCASCSAKVMRAVERLPGVSEVSVALMAERLALTLTPGTTAEAEIEGVVRKLGYNIAPKGPGAPGPALPDAPAAASHPGVPVRPDRGESWHRTGKGRLVILTGLLLAVAWGLELLAPAAAGQWAFLAACLIAAPWPRCAWASPSPSRR